MPKGRAMYDDDDYDDYDDDAAYYGGGDEYDDEAPQPKQPKVGVLVEQVADLGITVRHVCCRHQQLLKVIRRPMQPKQLWQVHHG
jgi:hypothetical protein